LIHELFMIFENAFFTEMLLPFLLVFVVVFSILRKSQILGEKAAQNDSIVAAVIGLILIAFPGPRDMLIGFIPWMAVGVVALLVFFILYGFVAGDLKKLPKGLKYTLGALAGIFTIWIVLYVSGLDDWVLDLFGDGTGDIWMNVIMVVLVLGAMAVAVFGGKWGNGGSGSGNSNG
jgi:hypothetical protein